MSHIGKIFFLFIMISIAVIGHPKAATLSGDQLAAEVVMNNYFAALTQGDANTIKSLLGGDQLEKRRRLLDNPTYPAHLISIYSNARLEITNNVAGNDSITIDAVITLTSGETMHRQFLLKKDSGNPISGYTIHSESTPEELNF